jgi:hypothetical protein
MLIAAVALAGCGSGSTTSGGSAASAAATSSFAASSAPASPETSQPAATGVAEPLDATALAKRIKAGGDRISRIVTITEDNDPNDKIGRPNGYTSAAVLYDDTLSCPDLGVTCGGTIEVWPSAADAKARSDYIQRALKDNPMLGTEYNYLRGPALFRVFGEIKPTAAKKLEVAFLR